jgi:hypothetical protein
VADADRRPVHLEGLLDGLDGAYDADAVVARSGSRSSGTPGCCWERTGVFHVGSRG